jgi:DNA polymerase (family 10)
MENKPIARKLRLLSQLMELHEVNPFKIKSIANAAFNVDKLPLPVASKSFEELEKISGIGKSVAAKILSWCNRYNGGAGRAIGGHTCRRGRDDGH